MSARTFGSLVAIVVVMICGLVGPAEAEPRQTRPPDPQLLVATPAGVLFELALDEVELFWNQIPGGGRIPAISTGNVLGASVLSQRGGQAVVTIAKVESVAELQDVAKTLQRANPGAVVKPVFYETGGTSTGSRRRIGTSAVRLVVKAGTTPESLVDPSAVTIRPAPEPVGTYVLETSDPMAALALTMTLRGRPDVTSAAISAAPERILRKHERLTAGGKVPGPFDEPEKAQEYFALKRQPVGETAIPVERSRTRSST
jgi:hypothetical protein